MGSSSRANITTRVREGASWDAGVHADMERGSIDLGLVVEPESVGVVLDAPQVGVLRLALEVMTDGATRLASASRTLADGRVTTLAVADEAKVKGLEARLIELEGANATLARARDQSAAELHQARTETTEVSGTLEALRGALDAERARWASTVKAETDARLVALGEREKARAELERVRGELDAGSATLMREISEARAARDATEHDKRRLSEELSEISERLKARVEEFNQLQALRGQLEGRLEAAQAEVRALTDRFETQAAEHRRQQQDAALTQARLTELEAENSTLRAERDASKAANAQLEQALGVASGQLDVLRAAAADRDALHLSHTERVTELEAQLQVVVEANRKSTEALAGANAQLEVLRAAADDRDALKTAQAERAAEFEALNARLQAASESHRQSEQALADANRELELLRAAAADRDALKLAEAERATELDALKAQLNDAVEANHEWERALAEANGQLEALRANDPQLEAALATERQQVTEAQNVARQLNANIEKLTAERDEARAVARQLHQKSAAKPGGDEQLRMQIDALSRQLEQERTARARALAERDDFRSRFKALAGPTSNRIEDSREETRPYFLAPATTQTEMPAIKINELRTDPVRIAPVVPAVKPPDKKKGK